MIVIASRPGQLGNQLFVYAHCLAFCIEKESKIYNPSFSIYQKYFPNVSNKQRHIINPIVEGEIVFKIVNLLARVIAKLNFNWLPIKTISLDWDQTLDLDLEKNFTRGNVFFVGWKFRSPINLNNNSKEIRELFSPSISVSKQAKLKIDQVRNQDTKIVAVHIRRGDYKHFEGGRYYYSFKQYADFLRSLAANGDKLQFILFSNEKIDTKSFEGIDFTISEGSEIEDLISISYCDYILGPPSTYSLWASFYGIKPLFHISNPAHQISLRDFEVPKSF